MRSIFARQTWTTHLLALLLIGLCLLLSSWQWHRAHYSRSAIKTSTVIDFNKLSKPRDFLPPSSIGQLTRVRGYWQPDTQIVLADRPRDGRLLTSSSFDELKGSGSWVVGILRLGDGTSVAVLRGWEPTNSIHPVSSRVQTITGVIAPAEDSPSGLAVNARPLITTNYLLARSKTNVRDGFIVSMQPDQGLIPVVPTRSALTQNGLHWLNVFYTFNWIFFALLIGLIWRRVIKDQVQNTT